MEARAMLIFEESIKSKVTLDRYNYYLKQFKNYYKLKDQTSILEIDNPRLQIMLEDYLFHMKRKELSRSYCSGTFSALELLCILNDKVGLNWKKIRKMMPASKKPTGQKPWSTTQIQKILESTSEKRTKAIIHILSDSWCRIGAIPGLKIRNLIETENNCMAIQFYEGETEEYWSFLTPEGADSVRDYLNERREHGENLKPDHPLIREKYSIAIAKPKHLKTRSVMFLIEHPLKKSGIQRTKVSKMRFDQQIDHGFRKRGETIMKNNAYRTKDPLAGAKIEKMMGHKVLLDGVYYQPDRNALFDLYKEAISDIVINDSSRILAEKIKSDAENRSLKEDKELMKDMQKEVRQLQNDSKRNQIVMDSMSKKIQQLGKKTNKI